MTTIPKLSWQDWSAEAREFLTADAVENGYRRLRMLGSRGPVEAVRWLGIVRFEAAAAAAAAAETNAQSI